MSAKPKSDEFELIEGELGELSGEARNIAQRCGYLAQRLDDAYVGEPHPKQDAIDYVSIELSEAMLKVAAIALALDDAQDELFKVCYGKPRTKHMPKIKVIRK